MRLPLWYRALAVLLFAGLLTAYGVVRSGGGMEALASLRLPPLADGLAPALAPDAAFRQALELPASGRYTVNGMRVKVETISAPIGSAAALRKVAAGMVAAGYEQKSLRIGRMAAVAGLHPETQVFLLARPARDPSGRPAVRMSQLNLADLDPDFRPVIEDIPTHASATHQWLITDEPSKVTQSLTYLTAERIDRLADFHRRELTGRGWNLLQAPAHQLGDGEGLLALFFTRAGEECQVVISRPPGDGQSMVMLSKTRLSPRGVS